MAGWGPDGIVGTFWRRKEEKIVDVMQERYKDG